MTMPTQEFKIPRLWRSILILVMLVCGINAAINLSEYARLKHFLQRGVETKGTAIACVDDVLNPCEAVIQYNVNGSNYQMTWPKWSCARKECFGRVVMIVYDPDNPNIFGYESLTAIRGLKFGGIIARVIAIIAVIIVVIWYVINEARLWRAMSELKKAKEGKD